MTKTLESLNQERGQTHAQYERKNLFQDVNASGIYKQLFVYRYFMVQTKVH